jgi:hypothetical protein
LKDNKSGALLELYPDVAEQWHYIKNGRCFELSEMVR